MGELARLLRGHKADRARTMAFEMGKPVGEGQAEVDKCAGDCEYWGERGEALPAEPARDRKRAERLVWDLEVGSVFVNGQVKFRTVWIDGGER